MVSCNETSCLLVFNMKDFIKYFSSGCNGSITFIYTVLKGKLTEGKVILISSMRTFKRILKITKQYTKGES